MLVLSRKASQSIVIGGEIRITVLSIDGGRVRLGIEASPTIPVLRGELIKRDDGSEPGRTPGAVELPAPTTAG